MRRNRNTLVRRSTQFRELDQRQAAEALRERQRAERLKAELPSIIENQVGEQIQKLESKLLSDFKEMGQRAVDESTAVLQDSLSDRLQTLEHISSIQSRTIVNLRDSSRAAEKKVSSVVDSIEQTLSNAVPGFRLEPAQYPQPQIEQARTASTRQSSQAGEEEDGEGYCPSCTSTNVRRAYRHGAWEQILRLFFVAPYRCRACRYKFYKFSF